MERGREDKGRTEQGRDKTQKGGGWRKKTGGRIEETEGKWWEIVQEELVCTPKQHKCYEKSTKW